MTAIVLFVALVFAGSEVSADIYRYTNEDGVECFTDAPTTRDAVRIVRERKESRKQKKSTPLPPVARAVPAEPQLRPVNHEPETDCRLPVPGRISSTVGLRHDPIDGVIRDHKGVDIATPEGTPIRPVASGVVVFSGYRQGYGNTIMVKHDDGMITLYAHNSTNLKNVGEPVDRSSTIAFSGSTGRTTGPHLHFEAWKEGVNLTATFIPGGTATASRHDDDIRRTVQADGTLFFTNLH